MMSWETELMKEHARLICHNKGSVVNVGHGMGIVDRAIQVSSKLPSRVWRELKKLSRQMTQVITQLLKLILMCSNVYVKLDGTISQM